LIPASKNAGRVLSGEEFAAPAPESLFNEKIVVSIASVSNSRALQLQHELDVAPENKGDGRYA